MSIVGHSTVIRFVASFEELDHQGWRAMRAIEHFIHTWAVEKKAQRISAQVRWEIRRKFRALRAGIADRSLTTAHNQDVTS